jgi:hypothetical protein
MNDEEYSIANLMARYSNTYLNGDDLRIPNDIRRVIAVDPCQREERVVVGPPYVGSEGIAFVMSQIAKGLQPYYLCMDRGILINVTEESIPANGVIVEWLHPEITNNLNREYSAIRVAKLEIEDRESAIRAIRERGTSKLF